MIMRVGVVVMRVIVRHADDRRPSDCSHGDLYARNFEYYYSDTAISSSTSGPPPTENTDELLAAGHVGHRRAGRVGRQLHLGQHFAAGLVIRPHRCGSRLLQVA